MLPDDEETDLARPAITDAVADAAAFMRAEWQLVVPVALALMGLPQALFQIAMPAELASSMAGPPLQQFHPWMLWMIPVMLLSVLGALSISALAIIPRLSVGEALLRGLQRLGSLVAAAILASVALGFALALVVVVLGGVLGALGLGVPGQGSFERVLLVVLAMLAAVRLFLFLPASVAADHLSPFAALRASWAATHGMFWRLFGLSVLLSLVGIVLMVAVQSGFGSLLLLLGTLTGLQEAAAAVVALLAATVGALLNAVGVIIIARVYRTLAPR